MTTTPRKFYDMMEDDHPAGDKERTPMAAHPPQTTTVMKQTDGTIIQFLEGSHSYDGIWFGEPHPTTKGQFWWRTILRDYIRSQSASHPSAVQAEALYTLEDMMNVAGWMAAADCKRPIHELKEEAEVYISKIKPASISAPQSDSNQ